MLPTRRMSTQQLSVNSNALKSVVSFQAPIINTPLPCPEHTCMIEGGAGISPKTATSPLSRSNTDILWPAATLATPFTGPGGRASLSPQARAVPLPSSAMVCWYPAETWTTPRAAAARSLDPQVCLDKCQVLHLQLHAGVSRSVFPLKQDDTSQLNNHAHRTIAADEYQLCTFCISNNCISLRWPP